jgi:hypothetical protein
MFWADSFGAKYIYDRLKDWSKYHGGIFEPYEYLSTRARQGLSLVRPYIAYSICSDTAFAFTKHHFPL